MRDLIEREAALCPKFTWPGKFNRKTVKIVTEVLNAYGEYLAGLPSAQPKSCEYWDAESNDCTLNRRKTFSEMVRLHDHKDN